MIRTATSLACILAAAGLLAASHVGFDADAFNAAVPALQDGTRVFSPVSFEIDCVVFAEAADTLTRAHVAERLGVLSGFEPEYGPILRNLSAGTNGLAFASARGVCVPESRRTNPVLRRSLQRGYGLSTCAVFPTKGAESWFRAAMDGEMEDFAMSVDSYRQGRYCYYDLVNVKAQWLEPFPLSNSRPLPFAHADGTVSKIDFMADVRVADTLKTGEYLLLRLPLKGGAFFYALLPDAGVPLDSLRGEVSSVEIRNLLASMRSVADPGVSREPTVIVLPRLAIDTSLDVRAVMTGFRFPIEGLPGLVGDSLPGELVQRTRFVLSENGADETPIRDKPAERQVHADSASRRAILNRPFLFFVHHEESDTLVVMGQFDGK